MLQFLRSLIGSASEADTTHGDVTPPPPQSEVPSHDPMPSVMAEQVRHQEQALEAVAAAIAAQQAIDTAVSDPHHH